MVDELARLQAENEKLKKINQALMYRVEEGGGNLNAAYSVFEHSVQLAMHVGLKTKELNNALEELQVSNRKLKQANLAANVLQQRFEDAIESISEAFVLLDKNDCIIYQNSIFRSFWKGTDFVPCHGDNYYDLRAVAKAKGVILNDIPARDNSSVYYLSNQRWYQLTERRTSEGGTVLLFTDITALKQAESQRYEQAIHTHNKLLQDLIDNLAQGIIMVNEQGVIEVWNQAFIRISNLKVSQLTRASKLSQLASMTQLDLLSVVESENNVQILSDGTVFDIRVYHLSDGKIIRSYTDVSESYYHAQTLKENEEWLRTITDNVPAMIAYIGADKRFQFTNKVYDNWYSETGQSLVNTALDSPNLFSDYGLLAPYIARALDGETVTFEAREFKDGRGYYFQKSYVPNKSRDGQVEGFFVLINDITERIDAGRALQEAYADLEKRVEERTQQLQQANESKSKFLAAVSHDLLQPLNAAQLFVNAMMGQAKNEALLNSMQSSLVDLENLIVTLVDISKLDAGVIKADKTAFELNQLLTNIASDYSTISSQYNVDFRFVACKVSVYSDSVLLARILRNYLSNAMRHSPSGRVILGCRRQGDFVNIEVWDNGEGIAEQDINIIFQEFKRLKHNHQTHQSLGLGLAIVDKMAKVLGHQINVKSKLYQGSCFSVRVPLANANFANQVNYDEQLFHVNDCQGYVWVVDNDNAICLGMKTLLEQWGYRVTTAVSLGQLQEQLSIEQAPCDLLIVDYHLDESTGLEVSAEIQNSRRIKVPTLMVTANYSAELKELTKSHGIAILNKPIKPLKLKMLMQNMLS